MERITMSIEPVLAKQFDAFITDQGYSNRSEALRDLIRERLESERLTSELNGYCVATLSYIYNHHELELASRITSTHHGHHELTLSSMHVHLDHDNCLEIAILRGAVKDVTDFANSIIATRGVRHGKVQMVPVTIHEEAGHHTAHPHTHSNPLT